MSFSSEIKQELSAHVPPARHCRLAEMAAILNFCSRVESVEGESPCVKMHTENLAVARKCLHNFPSERILSQPLLPQFCLQ